jgi:hypothetical protein
MNNFAQMMAYINSFFQVAAYCKNNFVMIKVYIKNFSEW